MRSSDHLSDSLVERPSAPPRIPIIRQRSLKGVLGRDWALGYMLLAPCLIVLIGLIAYPFFYAILLSLQSKQIGSPATFVGFQNFIVLWHNPVFYSTIRNTAIVTVVGVGAKFVVGLSIALVLNERIKLREFWRALLFFPWTIPIVVSAFSWRWILDDMNGVANLILANFGFVQEYILWLGDAHIAIWVIVAAVLWEGTPFYTMNFLAGLAAIPSDLYEAAKIDGAGTIQSFIHITVPSLMNVFIITTLLSMIWTANELQWVFILTKGGPGHATETFPMMAFSQAIGAKELGMGAAVALSFFPLFLVIIFFLTGRMLRTEE